MLEHMAETVIVQFSVTVICVGTSTGHLDIPQPNEILHTDIKVSLHLIGYEAFPLKPNIMSHYPRKDLHYSREVFN